MIEINLLPEEMRVTEGTPPARLAVIIAGVAIACLTSVFIAKYYMVVIPQMRAEIRNRDVEIKDLKVRKDGVEKIIADINNLSMKVETLDRLIQSRVRYARVLDRLCDAVPKSGAWLKSFNVTPAETTQFGRRYVINLTGYTVGESPLERSEKLSELMNRLEEKFRKTEVDASGINTFIGARFERPQLLSRQDTQLPAMLDPDPRVAERVKVPKEGLDFVMTMSFELISNPQ